MQSALPCWRAAEHPHALAIRGSRRARVRDCAGSSARRYGCGIRIPSRACRGTVGGGRKFGGAGPRRDWHSASSDPATFPCHTACSIRIDSPSKCRHSRPSNSPVRIPLAAKSTQAICRRPLVACTIRSTSAPVNVGRRCFVGSTRGALMIRLFHFSGYAVAPQREFDGPPTLSAIPSLYKVLKHNFLNELAHLYELPPALSLARPRRC